MAASNPMAEQTQSEPIDLFDGWLPVSIVGDDCVKVHENTRRMRVLDSGNKVSLCMGQCGGVPIEMCAVEGDVYRRVYMRAHGSDVISRAHNSLKLRDFIKHFVK